MFAAKEARIPQITRIITLLVSQSVETHMHVLVTPGTRDVLSALSYAQQETFEMVSNIPYKVARTANENNSTSDNTISGKLLEKFAKKTHQQRRSIPHYSTHY